MGWLNNFEFHENLICDGRDKIRDEGIDSGALLQTQKENAMREVVSRGQVLTHRR